MIKSAQTFSTPPNSSRLIPRNTPIKQDLSGTGSCNPFSPVSTGRDGIANSRSFSPRSMGNETARGLNGSSSPSSSGDVRGSSIFRVVNGPAVGLSPNAEVHDTDLSTAACQTFGSRPLGPYPNSKIAGFTESSSYSRFPDCGSDLLSDFSSSPYLSKGQFCAAADAATSSKFGLSTTTPCTPAFPLPMNRLHSSQLVSESADESMSGNTPPRSPLRIGFSSSKDCSFAASFQQQPIRNSASFSECGATCFADQIDLSSASRSPNSPIGINSYYPAATQDSLSIQNEETFREEFDFSLTAQGNPYSVGSGSGSVAYISTAAQTETHHFPSPSNHQSPLQYATSSFSFSDPLRPSLPAVATSELSPSGMQMRERRATIHTSHAPKSSAPQTTAHGPLSPSKNVVQPQRNTLAHHEPHHRDNSYALSHPLHHCRTVPSGPGIADTKLTPPTTTGAIGTNNGSRPRASSLNANSNVSSHIAVRSAIDSVSTKQPPPKCSTELSGFNRFCLERDGVTASLHSARRSILAAAAEPCLSGGICDHLHHSGDDCSVCSSGGDVGDDERLSDDGDIPDGPAGLIRGSARRSHRHLFPTAIETQEDGHRPNYRTELCRAWRETGTCRYGDRCQYAHGLDQLRGVLRNARYKSTPCKLFYEEGFCPFGPRCAFMHAKPRENRAVVASYNIAALGLLDDLTRVPFFEQLKDGAQ